MSTPPPITDELPLALRCYAAPTWRELPDKNATPKQVGRKKVAGASPWTLTFDCETTTHPGQALRFGAYQLRNVGELVESGLFYDSQGVSDAELATLTAYAGEHGLELRTRDGFADDVFFARAYQLRATIIGFNLPFDLSRLAIKHGSARAPLDGDTGGMRGGFTFRLSPQKIYPNVIVRHLSKNAASIKFAATMRQRDGRGQRNRGVHTPVRRGHFLDVKTLANALFAKNFSLATLSGFLQVANPKLDFDEFDGPITADMLHYAVRDVQATWECHAELAARFERLSLTRTLPEKVYSEAGIGKGYLKQMGIAPWRDVQPDVASPLFGTIMGSYFGGRSEVRIRREVRQVMLCDFLSMYPTVCTLMGLWRFATASGMAWQDSTDDTRTLLDAADLSALQSPATWARLATLVRVVPDGEIYPVRAAYDGEAQSTIGANHLSADRSLWFTLADCIAAKLLSGKTPRIIQALSFMPGPVQPGLEPIDIAGNPEYRVDPNTTDFFKRVIELRQSVKVRMKAATGDERTRLDTEQNALKICANSTSYGIWIEVNVEALSKRRSLTVHSTTSDPFSFLADKAEQPGRYFHPLLGTLITGAARLMLAITERLISDSGLEWAFCDTDSMAIAKPDAMNDAGFRERVAGIVDWFGSLNPYEFDGSILKVEDVNGSLANGAPEPLYCLAISSKRYALFNIGADGAPIMRKVSAHGLGHLLPPYGEANAPTHLPTPDDSVLRDGTYRWHCDLCHQIVTAALSGKPDRVLLDFHQALSGPAISRYAATSPELLRWFGRYNADRPYRDQIKPFGFLLSMTQAFQPDRDGTIATPRRGRCKVVRKVRPVAPFDRDHPTALASAFDRESGESLPASALKSYADALAQYHLSPESKFLNAAPFDRGATVRRHVRMVGTQHIGKESHDWERQAVLGLNADSEVAYGATAGDLSERLREFVTRFGERQAAKALGVTAARLASLTSGDAKALSGVSGKRVAARLPGATRLCEKLSVKRRDDFHELNEAIVRDGLRATARRLGVDPSNLRRRLRIPR